MLHEVDAALRSFLSARLPAEMTLGFDAPPLGGAANPVPPRKGADPPRISLFLHSVSDDPSGRNAGWTELRDASRTVVSRRLPYRRYQLSYLVTANAADPEEAHRILGTVLAAFANHDALPAECLSGSLAQIPLPVELQVASATGSAVARGMWAALGIAPRACLDLTVVAALLPGLVIEAHAPASTLNVDVSTSARPRAAAPGNTSVTGIATQAQRFTSVRVREGFGPTGTTPGPEQPGQPGQPTDRV
jgi:hypothetical protein